MVFSMRRNVALFCLLLAVVQRTVGQSNIGFELPCEAQDDPDPNNPKDNLSCPNGNQSVLVCYSRGQLCDGVNDCDNGADEGLTTVPLQCNFNTSMEPQFVCISQVQTISATLLCDGNDDCMNGRDETTTMCENKCLLPYYGGCDYSRECITSEFSARCGECLGGFAPDPDVNSTNCLIEIGLERSTYTGSESNQTTDEICAVLLADSMQLNLTGSVGDVIITALITPTEISGSANESMDYVPQQMNVTLSAHQPRDCIKVGIVDDQFHDPNEMFSVVLSTNHIDATLASDRETANVTILDDDELRYGYALPAYFVDEDAGPLTVAVELTTDSGIPLLDFRVIVSTSPNSAISPEDFTTISNVSLTFIAMSVPGTTQSFMVAINDVDDNEVESMETFMVSVTSNDPEAVAVRPTAMVTIFDNEIPNVGFNPIVYMIDEDLDVEIQVCVELQSMGILPNAVEVNMRTQDGTAMAPMDYVAFSGRVLTFPSGSTMGQLQCTTIQINDDVILEQSGETFFAIINSSDAEISPGRGQANITLQEMNDDVAEIALSVVEPEMFEGMLQECTDERLLFRLEFGSGVSNSPGSGCNVAVRTENGSAQSGYDFSALSSTSTFSADNTFCEFHIDILDDFVAEEDEYFNIILSSNDTSRCIVKNDNITILIRDDEDCIDDPCGGFEMCEELMCPNNFTCMLPDGNGDDPHFAVTLATGKTLCYTVQGEHGFAFNLISNQKVYVNAMFVPDAYRDEVTWLGTMGIVINNNGYKKSNMTKLRFEAIKNLIHIDNQMILEARNIERITLKNGKLMISEAPPTEGYKQPFVRVNLKDVELSFSIKFMTEHLDLYWHSTGQKTADSHGLIGQFFHSDVWLDEVRKILILPGKEPVPVQRKPLWAFMERESGDSTNFCWVAMNPGFQGEGLIDGSYFDYLVDDVLSTEFKFKKL